MKKENMLYETNLTAEHQAVLINALDRFQSAMTAKFEEAIQRLEGVRARISDHTVLNGDQMMSLAVATLDYQTLTPMGVEIDHAVLEPMIPSRWHEIDNTESTDHLTGGQKFGKEAN